jgi:uncharacterized paraquat-inducible protein A
MRKSLPSIAVGALLTSISLFLLALAYPRLFPLLGLLFVTACIILGLSLIAAIPKASELLYRAIRKSETAKQERATCGYCGVVLPEKSVRCPNCGAPVKESS